MGNIGGLAGGALGGFLGSRMPNPMANASKAATGAQLVGNANAENQDRWNTEAGMMNASQNTLLAQQFLGQGLGSANATLNPYYQSGLGANSMLQNALGMNGASGNQAATNAFQAAPGYQWALGQGANLVTNNAAASGLLNSTQFANSLTGFGQGMADQQYNTWLDRLTGMAGAGQNAGADMSSNTMNASARGSANQMQLGGELLNAYTGLGENMASMSENQGNIQASGINNYANAVQNQIGGYMGLGAYMGGQLGNMFKPQLPQRGGATSNYTNAANINPTSYNTSNSYGSSGSNSGGGLMGWLSSFLNRGSS